MNPPRPGRFDKFILAAIFVGLLAHLGAVHLIPRLRYGAAMDALSNGGLQFNHWTRAERFHEPAEGAFMPNPDLMSAACVYDVSPGAVLIEPAAWDAYWSISFYDDQGHAYRTISDREARSRRFVLLREGQRPPAGEAEIIESPSARGMVVLRRLAPTASRHAEATRIAQGDVCGNLAALNR